jgi:receptor protein-tyrosine kinase
VNFLRQIKPRWTQKEAESADFTELTEHSHLGKSLVTIRDPYSAASEAYRSLRTNLFYGVKDYEATRLSGKSLQRRNGTRASSKTGSKASHLLSATDETALWDQRSSHLQTASKVIIVTSPGQMEGKSTICANLGVVLAQAAKSTLVMDCDFRKPEIHTFFGLPDTIGTTTILAGYHHLQEAWTEVEEGLKVLPAGPVPHNPAEILSSQRFLELIATVQKEFDYVLVDTYPIGSVTDAAILAAQGDGVLLVLDPQKTRKGDVMHARRNLDAVGANVLGMVMNNIKQGA